ncbi:glycine--tRNA ligase subunit beta [Leptolyngbya sp. FACHB-671]|uniref:glycine--tRNA ligase subunit beta n=1 Tax=Leptolyngbya sp. FACHB-671 TaxID=2692812 RepID=UPI0016899DAB|nr:glycine--tRNA ligase subunit beta [Leptolyngbya sp. FACHB-671]MBD2066847.1 glycine--tRNA ligase subunit beta [Leptolyngbya sp. FACHB-671]
MATFLLEVGAEELPASFVDEALAQWRSRIPASLSERFLTSEAIELYGTPRRLAVLIKGLPAQQPDREEEVKGPPAQAAFKNGQPTKAAEGFARSRNVELSDLQVRATDKGEFVFVQQKIPGRPTAEILTELIPNWIFSLEGRRFMRWGDGDLRFPRPIRWLVTLLDDTVLPITLVNGSESCTSDRTSQVHRVLHPQPINISAASDYLANLRSGFVEADPEQRKTKIQSQVQVAAKELGGSASVSPNLLQEVTNLVEWPTAVVGKFDPDFLELPAEVIITEMESHQRYFPVLKQEDSTELLPYFITISNGDPAKSDLIAAGNERVIRARLSDGKFFFDADRTIPLEDYLPRLEKVTFQEDLGSVRDKVDRFSKIANRVAGQLQVNDAQQELIQRAALLCKADLVTQMVGEFPELQGIMGQKYALTSGEPEAIATAIFEHYLPRGAGDQLPQTLPGQVVGIADRLDTLVGIFSLGMLPSGSSDPFALRRAANAIINITWSAKLPLNLDLLLEQVVADFAAHRSTPAELLTQLQDFFLQRIRSLLQEDQIDYDLVNAVLGENDPEYTERALKDLLDVRDRAQFLQAIRQNKDLDTIYETVNRASRLAQQGNLDTIQLNPEVVVQPKLFQQPSEQAFYDALVQLVPQTEAAQAERDYQKLVNGLKQIAPIISNFFDGPQSVLVMDSNPDIKRNRLNLLGLLRNHARVLADFGAIVKG